MKIRNETDYQTVGIQKCLTAVHNHLARDEGRLRTWRWVTFTVRYTRTQATSGHARYDGSHALLRISRPKSENTEIVKDGRKQVWGDRTFVGATAAQLIELAWHEMLHLYGYKHGSMARYWPERHEVEEMAEAAGFDPDERMPLYADARRDLGLEPEPEGPSEAERYERELRHALRKRKAWTIKAKRAKTALEKWRKRERYRRRRLEELGVDVDAIVEDEIGDYDLAMAGDVRV